MTDGESTGRDDDGKQPRRPDQPPPPPRSTGRPSEQGLPGGPPLPGTESEWPDGVPAQPSPPASGPPDSPGPPQPQSAEPPRGTAESPAGQPGRIGPWGGLDASALATSLLEIPWYAWSLALIYVLAGTFVSPPWHWIVVAVWLLAGAVMSWRPAEVTVARFLLRLRQPSMSEAAKLDAALKAVAQSAKVPASRYVVLIEEGPEVSALAYGGHTIAVTRWSLSVLAPRQLEAVLAHELGHHISGHTWPSALGLWYTLPARGAVWLIKAAVRVSRRIPVLGCILSGFLTAALLGMLLSALIFGYFSSPLVFVILALLAPVILASFDRLAEKNADKVAARIGYGQPLLEVLNGWQAQGRDNAHYGGTRRSAMMSRHPSIADRIRALEKQVYRDRPQGPA